MPRVVSLGTMLVEIMRTELDEPFDRPGTFAGPYPSGDTPVYVNAVARLGGDAGFLGAVGADGFGECILRRFAEQGVDASHVRVLPDRTTGIAFVSYASDGSREFIFHWKEAAAGQIGPEYVDEAYVCDVEWLHLTGGNLVVTERSYAACLRAMTLLSPSAVVSFDPNIRAEWLETADIERTWRPVLKRADYLLPSEGEAALLTGETDDETACRILAARGKIVVQKRGAQGCRVFTKDEAFEIGGFDVEEIDPTGAGDTFCAGFTVAVMDGLNLHDAAKFANAVGALAVTKRGPMEGAPTRSEVAALIG